MKLNEKTKITIFGDSIGKGISTDGGSLKVLDQNAVSLFEKEYNITVDNRSSYGQSLSRFIQKGGLKKYLSQIDSSNKNIVVLELGGNDADFDWKSVGIYPEKEHLPKTPIENFSKIYGETINELQKSGVKVVVCTIVPISSKRYLDNVISSFAQKQRVLEFFKGDYNTIHRHQEMFNNEILKNSYRSGVDVIDLRKKFLDTNAFEDMMCLDGIHPNEKGHKQIFNAVNEFLAS